ncbi:MAG: hypothetical protein EGMGGAKC_00148 [Dehalococcoides mccartyi]|nr:hypothetical protein [Dehalococcoides mccartyi]
MQCAHYQMACFGCAYSRRNSLQVTHFTHQYYIRVMPQGVFQSSGKRFGIVTQISLGNNAAVIGIKILNGVFYGNDVTRISIIQVVYHGGHGGGFTAAGRPGYQNKTARFQDKLFADFGYTQFIYRAYLKRYLAEGNADRAALFHHVYPEAGYPGYTIGKVQLFFGIKYFTLFGGGYLFQYLLNGLVV